MTLEVAAGAHVIELGKLVGIHPQGLADFRQRPDVELAFFAFRIGIERGGEGAFRRGHFPLEPADGFPRALGEQRFAAALPGQRQQFEELGVVVEHLLEMRHQPALVDRIAREAAAEMIVNAALAHMLERVLDRLEETRVAAARPGAPEEFEDRALRKFGRAAQTAVDGIEHVADLHRRRVELLEPEDDLARRPRLVGELRQQRGAVLLDLLRLLAKQPRHLAQHVGESRPAEARFFGEVSAAPHRLAFRRQKHGQRPAALLAE